MDTDVQVFALPDASPVPALARAFASAGGRVLIVGGWVRDRVLGRGPQDVDLEVHGLAAAAVMEILESFGRVKRVGHAFAVFRVRGLALQIGLPPATTAASRFDIAGALRRRDLTVNSMAWDPLSCELFDPFDGRRDLRFGMLRATDRETFGSDALRALRVAQFVARFSMRPDAELVELCAACDLSVIPGEPTQGSAGPSWLGRACNNGQTGARRRSVRARRQIRAPLRFVDGSPRDLRVNSEVIVGSVVPDRADLARADGRPGASLPGGPP